MYTVITSLISGYQKQASYDSQAQAISDFNDRVNVLSFRFNLVCSGCNVCRIVGVDGSKQGVLKLIENNV